jgi:hypothetical protein
VVEEEEVDMWFEPLVLNDRTDHNDICMKIPCTDAEADVDVERCLLEKPLGLSNKFLAVKEALTVLKEF